jgi:signal transduction histidine kinase
VVGDALQISGTRRSWLSGWSLRSALLIYVVLPLAVVLITAGALALRELERQMERRLQEDVELVARAIQPALSRALEQDRSGSINQALEAAFSIDRVYGAYVYNSEGESIAAAGRSDALPSRRRVSSLAREGEQLGEYGEVAGRQVYSYFVPLTDSGARIIGVLQVTRRASDFAEYIGLMRQRAAMAGILALGVVALLVLYGHHGAIGSHLIGIGLSMREVSAGNRAHRSPVRGPAEIAHLAGSLNAMLDSMQEAERKVERHQAAEIELLRRLQRSEKLAAIGQLAAGVAHELGTPLSLIYGKSQRLLRTDPPVPVRESLVQINAQVSRMERIIRQLLDFGRGHSTQSRRVRADLLLRSAIAIPSGGESSISEKIELTGPRPAPEVDVDPFRFEQALENLLRNAVQAGTDGRIRASWSGDDREVTFTIEDDGEGISPDIRNRVFEPFFTTKKPGEGTGLGLSLVHRIVEEHGGRVEMAESELGGALFRIVLPAAGQREAPLTAGEKRDDA